MRLSFAAGVAVVLALAVASPTNITESGELAAYISMGDDKRLALNLHNKFRGAVHVKNLAWDLKLQRSAEAYARKLAKRPGGHLIHSGPGENLWWSSAHTDHDLQRATQGWTNEKHNYHGEKIPKGNFESYGHYIWSSTQRVGIAAVRDRKGGIYVVAHYDPPGN
ncbi:PR-1-like protein [Thozetella sp. PMI_491]|nr:PR-1-like protein [Thozetella sp. PMI_491]